MAEGPNPDGGKPICRSRDSGEGSAEARADNHAYRLTHAVILFRDGRTRDGLQITQEVIAAGDVAAQDKARALCQLGDVASIGPTHDYKQAIEYYTKAIEAADPLVKHRTAAIRRDAKHVLVDAHLGARCAWRGAIGTRKKRSCRSGLVGRAK